MGMYTGLRFSARLKPEYVDQIQALIDSDMICPSPWEAFEHESIKAFATFPRSSMIPFGSICYMPDGWDQTNRIEDGLWHVCCSLKNYSGEVTKFINSVLPVIADSAYGEYLYEEFSKPDTFSVVDGNVTIKQPEMEVEDYY